MTPVAHVLRLDHAPVVGAIVNVSRLIHGCTIIVGDRVVVRAGDPILVGCSRCRGTRVAPAGGPCTCAR